MTRIYHAMDGDLDGLTSQQIARILSVPHFEDAREAREDIRALYFSYAINFADLIMKYHFVSEPNVIADIGTGYG